MTASARPPRVLLFTAQDVGYQLVTALSQREDIQLLVVTSESIRDRINGYRSAITVCADKGISCIQATKVSPDILDQLAEFDPDIMISAYFPHIIPVEVQALSRLPAVNIHPGILPHYRGRYPTPWYILNGAEKFGIAIHELDGGIDTGPVLCQELHDLKEAETGHELYRRIMDLAATMIVSKFDDLFAGRLTPQPQIGTGSYYSRIEPRYQIDWNQSRQTILRRVRVHAKPYFPAYSFMNARMVSINRASRAEDNSFGAQGGGIIDAVLEDGRFLVSCADGLIQVDEFSFFPELSSAEIPLYLRKGARFEM